MARTPNLFKDIEWAMAQNDGNYTPAIGNGTEDGESFELPYDESMKEEIMIYYDEWEVWACPFHW